MCLCIILMEFNINDAINELKEFNNENLEKMVNLETDLKEVNTEELIMLYNALEETRQHLLKVQSIL